MADGTACPEDENSTDCLLRELLRITKDKDEEFNWDPLTFAFLVPIGLVAALFAALTIIQAIISAGSGRRRCNKVAIGRWSELTTRKWSWDDLMFLSTAKTPLLRCNSILSLLNNDENGQQRPGTSAAENSSSGTSAATWLKFLQEIGLEDLILSSKDEYRIIAKTAADYLPSDSLAVPAYGEVGFMVAMAAAAGAYSWNFNSQSPYPVIVGEDFQFDFRQHPTLGTVGVFSRYLPKAENNLPCSRKDLAKAIQHARGEIDIATLLPLDELVREQLSLEEGPISMNIIELPSFKDLLRGTHRIDKCKNKKDPVSMCKLPSYFERSDEHLLWLFIADTPEHPPAIFPSELIHVPNLLSILALNSNFWTTERKASIDLDFTAKTEVAILPDDLSWENSFQANRVLPADRKIFGYKDIYQGCFKLLYEPQAFQAWFDSQERSKKQVFRQGVVAQLQQIDIWLRRQNEQEIRCSIVCLHRITNALAKAEKAITNDSFGASISADQADAQPTSSGDSHRKDMNNCHANAKKEYFEILVNRHAKTLTTLRNLVDECLPKEDRTKIVTRHKEETVKNFMRHREILQALVGISPSLFSSLLNFGQIVLLLQNLGKLIEGWKNTEEGEQWERSHEEIIKDVVIWRCILIALLFWTAPDDSKVLSSGLWEHVIPII